MSIKLKLAAVAAVALIASPAFALDSAGLSALATDGTAPLANADGVSAFIGNADIPDGGVAVIAQQTASALAYIDQSGAANMAGIFQAAETASAVIAQQGDNNVATVFQH